MRRIISYVQSLLVCGVLMTACDPTEPTSDLIPPPPTDPNIHIYPRLHPSLPVMMYINFSPYHADSHGIWLSDLDGNRRFTGIRARYADWSPAGDSIVYEQFGVGIHVAAFDTATRSIGQPNRITDSGFNPSWGRTGRIAFYLFSTEDLVVWTIRPDGSDAQFQFPGHYPIWNLDGTELIFLLRTFQPSPKLQFSRYDMVQRKIVQSYLIQLSEGSSELPRLNPVGHAIAYLDHRFELQRLELHSGLVTPVRQIYAHSFDWTQDGTGFIVSRGHVDQLDLSGRFVRRIIRHPYYP